MFLMTMVVVVVVVMEGYIEVEGAPQFKKWESKRAPDMGKVKVI